MKNDFVNIELRVNQHSQSTFGTHSQLKNMFTVHPYFYTSTLEVPIFHSYERPGNLLNGSLWNPCIGVVGSGRVGWKYHYENDTEIKNTEKLQLFCKNTAMTHFLPITL